MKPAHTRSLGAGSRSQPLKPVLLTFAAGAPNTFSSTVHPLEVTNTATITSGSLTFQRSTDVLLVLPHAFPLEGSFKAADHNVVAPGQVFTYTINLHNSSEIPISTTVSDPLPAQVSYIPGSASDGGNYDTDESHLELERYHCPRGLTRLVDFCRPGREPGYNSYADSQHRNDFLRRHYA